MSMFLKQRNQRNRQIVGRLESEIGVHWHLLNRWRKQRDKAQGGSQHIMSDIAEETRCMLIELLEIRKAGRA